MEIKSDILMIKGSRFAILSCLFLALFLRLHLLGSDGRMQGDAALRPLYVRVRKALMENLAKNNAPFEAALKVGMKNALFCFPRVFKFSFFSHEKNKRKWTVLFIFRHKSA